MQEQPGLQFRGKSTAERYITDPHKPRRPILVTDGSSVVTPSVAETVTQIKVSSELHGQSMEWLAPRRSLPDVAVEAPKVSRLKYLRRLLHLEGVSLRTTAALLAVGMLGFGFVSLMSGLRAQRIPVEAQKTPIAVVKGAATTTPSQVVQDLQAATVQPTTEKTDTKGVGVIAEDKPTDAVVARYIVASGHIKYLSAPSIGIKQARVMRSSVAENGSLDMPKNIWDASWYDASSLPLDRQGSVLLLGHVKGETNPGLFYDLYRINVGELIILTLGDGSVVTYKVVSKQDVLSDNIAETGLLTSKDSNQASLTLLTAFGEQNPLTGQYEKRQAVFAIRSN
jgi:sortase A